MYGNYTSKITSIFYGPMIGNSPIYHNFPHFCLYIYLAVFQEYGNIMDIVFYLDKYALLNDLFELLSTPHNSWGGWGLWGFLWWAPSAKRKDHHGVSSGWSSTSFHSNTDPSSTQYEQIPIIFGDWPFWLTLFLFLSITFWRVYG